LNSEQKIVYISSIKEVFEQKKNAEIIVWFSSFLLGRVQMEIILPTIRIKKKENLKGNTSPLPVKSPLTFSWFTLLIFCYSYLFT